MRKFYVFAYDIQSDKQRGKVSNLLSQYAMRVQNSLFEGVMDSHKAQILQSEIEAYLVPGDYLRIYPLEIQQCADIGQYGGAPVQSSDDYWLL